MRKAARIGLLSAAAILLVAIAVFSCPGETQDGVASLPADPVTYSGAAISELPVPRDEGPLSLEAAIRSRRSVREYTSEPLSLSELGQLLWAAQGITSDGGARAAPSAGGTYPLELYVAVGNVTGLEPGIYHYLPPQHALAMISAGDIRPQLAEASLAQTWVGEAAADVVVTALYSRTTARYGERGVRYVHMEAGHAAQNLCLQATALALGAVTVGAFTDEEVRELLRLPADTQPLYVIAVGHPVSP